jgi:hypothetical protein
MSKKIVNIPLIPFTKVLFFENNFFFGWKFRYYKNNIISVDAAKVLR